VRLEVALEARRLVVVPHTHWDREWYRTHEEFRYRLVRLLDDVLELLETGDDFRHFTLDGQTVVLGDYLEVRPHARERLAKLIRAGRLVVGPWFVLPDEWLVSGEALIRNLRLGMRQAEAFGGSMRLGYVPDQFGHVGQLPQLFAGFGFPAAVLWRGVGEDVDRTLFHWEAPDGTRLFSVYLPFGYGNAVHLPRDPDALVSRLRFEVGRLEAMSDVPTVLLMNGSDHVRPRADLPRALEHAVREIGKPEFEIGTLPGFVERVQSEAPSDLPLHRGELRSGLRSPLLPGCASARLWIKQADFRNDRLLTRYLEPLAAWVGALGVDADPEVIDHAWRSALENHPHDSICGCSVDRVHDQMRERFRRTQEIGTSHLDLVTAEWTSRVAARVGGEEGETIVAWSPHPAGRAEALAEVELDLPVGPQGVEPFHLQTPDGRRVAASADLLEPEQVLSELSMPPAVVDWMLPALEGEFGGLHAQAVRWRRRGETLELEVRVGTAPGRLDLDALRRDLAATIEGDGVRRVAFRARRPARLRLRFVDDMPGWGLRAYRVVPGAASFPDSLEASELSGGGVSIANESWRIEVQPDGRVMLESRAGGERIDDALRLVSEGDRGDEYNFDPVPDEAPVTRPERVSLHLDEPTATHVGLSIAAQYRVPAGLVGHRRARARRKVRLPVRIRLRLLRSLDRVDVDIELDNTAQDHRLRVELRAPFKADRFQVESAFEVVERPIAPAPSAFGSDRPAERPIGACPQRSFACLDDGRRTFSVANRGLAEVEALEGEQSSSLAITLLRAVGWLSRGDLALRPGDAGPPLATPGAQVPGSHRAELSLRLDDVGVAAPSAQAHRFAYPPLAVVGGAGPTAPMKDGDSLVAVSDPLVLLTAIEPRGRGAAIVRGYNASSLPRRVRVRWLADPGRRLEPVDLAEAHPRGPVVEEEAELELRPWELFTLRVHEKSPRGELEREPR